MKNSAKELEDQGTVTSKDYISNINDKDVMKIFKKEEEPTAMNLRGPQEENAERNNNRQYPWANYDESNDARMRRDRYGDYPGMGRGHYIPIRGGGRGSRGSNMYMRGGFGFS